MAADIVDALVSLLFGFIILFGATQTDMLLTKITLGLFGIILILVGVAIIRDIPKRQ